MTIRSWISDPATWISERLKGGDRELAQAIWDRSKGAVNPRHTYGHWLLAQRYDLVHHEEKPEATSRVSCSTACDGVRDNTSDRGRSRWKPGRRLLPWTRLGPQPRRNRSRASRAAAGGRRGCSRHEAMESLTVLDTRRPIGPGAAVCAPTVVAHSGAAVQTTTSSETRSELSLTRSAWSMTQGRGRAGGRAGRRFGSAGELGDLVPHLPEKAPHTRAWRKQR